MTPESPTAQSGPSEQCTRCGYVLGTNSRCDTCKPPPAGARDAVTDAVLGIAFREAAADYVGPYMGPLGIESFIEYVEHRAKALPGKADGPQEIMPPSREPKTERDVRQVLADLHREYQERCQPFVDILVKIEANKPPTMAWMPKATQPAATGGVSTKEMHDRIEAHFARMDAAATGMGDGPRHPLGSDDGGFCHRLTENQKQALWRIHKGEPLRGTLLLARKFLDKHKLRALSSGGHVVTEAGYYSLWFTDGAPDWESWVEKYVRNR